MKKWKKEKIERNKESKNWIEYIERILKELKKIEGERKLENDEEIKDGLGSLKGKNVEIIGKEKG